jgi:hypothetical protein
MDRKQLLLDLSFILAGIALSVVFVSADNAESPLAALIQMLFFIAVTAVISFTIVRFTTSKLGALFASILITDLSLALLLIVPELFSPHADPHEHQEMLSLWPIVTAVYTAPLVVLCSLGFVSLANRLYRRSGGPAYRRQEVS